MSRERRDEDSPSQKPVTAYVTEDEQRLVDNAAKNRQMNRSALARQLILEGISRTATTTRTARVTEIMQMPCGMPTSREKLLEALGEGISIEIFGEDAADATPNSFIVRADGVSMYDGSSLSIDDKDRILMTPLEEYPTYLEAGKFVLAEIEYQNGEFECTLKKWVGPRLLPTNPKFDPVEFGSDVKTVRIVAVARRVLGKPL